MSERDEFEAWAGRNFLDVTRNRGMVINYVKPDMQLAWLAWQAARATPQQAVPALTDEQIGLVWIREMEKPGDARDRLVSFARALGVAPMFSASPAVLTNERNAYIAFLKTRRGEGQREAWLAALDFKVTATTDEQIIDLWNRSMGDVSGLQSRAIAFARALLAAAPQPSPEPKEPEHAHDWRFSLQDHLYKCDCGATRGDYPFGAASFKD